MKTWTTSDYSLNQPTDAGQVLDLVWRTDFTGPGFSLLDLGPGVDSHTLRSRMVTVKNRLSDIAKRPFVYRSMSRFDQQETTKFHIDGAPPESMLMLGYERSNVRSRLFLADYSQAAFDLGIEPTQFLKDFNPMFRKGEDVLAGYITELPQPEPGHARILLINNSWLSFSEARTNPLGVMHTAIIVTPDESERRIVNSILLATEGEEVGVEEQAEFVRTDKISQKVY
jgi:hypothetical protein